MLYTVGQLMSVLSLSKQQWRTFRQALPRLNSGEGRSAALTAGDLLAAAVARSLVHRLQLPATALCSVAESLFHVCGTHAWPRLERSRIALDLDTGRATLVDAGQSAPKGGIVVLVDLSPIVAALRAGMMADGGSSQRDLAFPPMAAGGTR